MAPPQPQLVEEVLEAVAAAGCAAETAPWTGAMLRALAGTKPFGIVLWLGDDGADAVPWLLAGIDYGTRIIAVFSSPELARALDRLYRDELRITVHHQAPDGFLEDVRAHRFDLVGGSTAIGPDTVTAAISLLKPAGVALFPRPAAGHPERDRLDRWLGDHPDLSVVPVEAPAEALLVTRHAPPPRPRRRGGRRARIATGP